MAKDLTPVVTPVGDLNWVNISGQGKENYNEDGYNYVATVHLEGDKALGLKQKIDDVLGEVPKGKTVKSTGYRKLWKDAEGNLFTPTSNRKPGDGDEETEVYAFTFTTGTTYADGKTKKVNVFNCASPPQKVNLGDRKVANGSVGAISGKLQRFERGKEIGVSLFLNAIQLTKFVEYTEDAGFEGQEGDFSGVEDEETGFVGEPEGGDQERPVKAAAGKAKPRL